MSKVIKGRKQIHPLKSWVGSDHYFRTTLNGALTMTISKSYSLYCIATFTRIKQRSRRRKYQRKSRLSFLNQLTKLQLGNSSATHRLESFEEFVTAYSPIITTINISWQSCKRNDTCQMRQCQFPRTADRYRLLSSAIDEGMRIIANELTQRLIESLATSETLV